jgi:tetratricopeptide (TPR) repeat protein
MTYDAIMRKSINDHRILTVLLGSSLLSLVIALPSLGQSYEGFRFDRYKDCVREVSINAEQAYETANRWRRDGGGTNAMHCEALALSALEIYPSAAKMLERVAKSKEIESSKQRAELWSQAGHAWILADRKTKALAAFSTGLDHVSLENEPFLASDLWIGRAHAHGLEEDWESAEEDLDRVLNALPQQYDAILLRASIRRAQGNYPGAAQDLAFYLTLLPDEVDGLMERGFLRMDVKDLEGARLDFEKVMEIAPESRAALQAQLALSKIAFRLDR